MANRNTYLGLFCVTAAVLMYEILLTRVFSVIAYYHFAFMAVSLALFGLTLGSLLVYFDFRIMDPHKQLTSASLLFSVTILFSLLMLVFMPLRFSLDVQGLVTTSVISLLVALPFVFSGMCVCLTLTKFPLQTHRLYAADLIGSGLGCIGALLALNHLSAPNALVLTAVLAGTGAVFFSQNIISHKLKLLCRVTLVVFCILGLGNQGLEKNHLPSLRFLWVKNSYEPFPLYEKWNIFSRVAVSGDLSEAKPAFGWGLSRQMPHQPMTHYVWLQIDSSAATVLTQYDNNIEQLDYLKYDVSNIVHYFRPNSRVLVIGAGGGRDILSALAFHQRSVSAIEINPNIIEVLTGEFADYTGHLDKNPKVTLINDEARSHISRSAGQYDIIQMSLIDTWAATASGAYALSENALYTQEGWAILLKHLSPSGILSVSRWYQPEMPVEMYRLTTLAIAALTDLGIPKPMDHIIILSTPFLAGIYGAVATLLLSPTAFSAKDFMTVSMLTKKLNFKSLLSPGNNSSTSFLQLFSKPGAIAIANKLGFDLSPPTDDKPFFFQFIKLNTSLFKTSVWRDGLFLRIAQPIIIIGFLLLLVSVLTLLCVITPLLVLGDKSALLGSSPLLLYFASIGFGFMFVELSQVQRLGLFLGHPTYGLSVVLFALLLSTGLGSFLALKIRNVTKSGFFPFAALLITLILFGWVSPALFHFQETSITVRILMTLVLLFPVGLFLGIALPLGMRLANQFCPEMTPWLWGVNGATSVVGSVLALAIALLCGITVVFWLGVACYFFAILFYYLGCRQTLYTL